jgi:hypothetical protein
VDSIPNEMKSDENVTARPTHRLSTVDGIRIANAQNTIRRRIVREIGNSTTLFNN